MLQVKDPQEVFDELVKPMIDLLAEGLNEESTTALNELVFRAYTLGEMYGTVSTCLARQVPIEKELWDNLATKHFVRGNVDDVTELKNGIDVPFLPERFTSDKPIILLP